MAQSNKLKYINKSLTILSNIAVVLGILFAIIQIRQNIHTEKRMVAINAVNQLRSKEFLKSYANLKTVYKTKK